MVSIAPRSTNLSRTEDDRHPTSNHSRETTMTAIPVANQEVEVVVEGLRKKLPQDCKNPEERYTERIRLLESEPLSTLWIKLRELGYDSPDSIGEGDRSYLHYGVRNKLRPYEEIEVVEGQSENVKSININERIIAKANRQYGKPIEFNVSDTPSGDPKRPTKSIRDNGGFCVSFQRTTRMPDDNKLHQLPASLGTCDLFNVNAYADRLPDNITEVGGVFLPMWQREAVWINFDMGVGRWATKYAVRVFVGRVNAVSGLLMDEDPSQKEGQNSQQDYVVIPGQQWLDGICVAPGVVRQFVAMPLGSGYTVEGQKSSEEKYGGLQIEVIPELRTVLRFWTRNNDDHVKLSATGSVNLDRAKGLDEMKTPAELGLRSGDKIRSYPAAMIYTEPFKIVDLLDRDGSATMKATYYYPSAYSRQPQSARHGSPYSLDIASETTAHMPAKASTRPAPHKAPPVPQVVTFGPPKPQGVTLGSPVIHGNNIGEPSGIHLGAHPPLPPPSASLYTDKIGATEAFKETVSKSHTSSLGNSSKHDSKIRVVSHGIPASSYLSHSHGDDSGGQRSSHSHGPEGIVEDESLAHSIGDLEVEDDTLIDVETKDLKAMGLAAGGKLVQDIYKDPYPATIWNHDAARIVHVHILDPASCEKVTHIVPPPPPIDAKTYAEQDGPFFVVEEQVDNRVEGGDFDNVKSVSQMDKKAGVTTEPEFDPLKPKMCTACSLRLCDCIIRPCDHQFCNMCIKKLEREGEQDPVLARKNWKCPTCNKSVSHVAGFSAPMNLPGEEPMRMKVPVHVLNIEDGRARFTSIQKTRI
ncbi:hypothetical protein K469DRAFT_676307 [Zopfia rhizophila CBS 207.26]|uniref:RING-type domain-containing protein n=1 Tax=Zopfia rhizophila CBS 207.26 TaxID=1314779 RepID=A0A6A6DI56_9PEZI|nr:hypothetical protein K469DRAFT_676307 [Zopfia rhizophila CBS 207.26]